MIHAHNYLNLLIIWISNILTSNSFFHLKKNNSFSFLDVKIYKESNKFTMFSEKLPLVVYLLNLIVLYIVFGWLTLVSSGSQFFRTTTGIQSGPDAFDKLRFIMTFLTLLGATETLCSFLYILILQSFELTM